MDGRSFISEFLQVFYAKAVLPNGLSPQGMQDVCEMIFSLDAVVDQRRVRKAFAHAVKHLMTSPEHVNRSYPRRLQELLESFLTLEMITPEALAKSLAKACSCDYLEWPRQEDWRKDESLQRAAVCGVLEMTCRILPLSDAAHQASKALPLQERLSGMFFLSNVIDHYQSITELVPELVGRPQSFKAFGMRLLECQNADDFEEIMISLKVLLLTPSNSRRSDAELSVLVKHLQVSRCKTAN